MSFTALKPYFRDRLTSLGFKESKDPFGPENIPSTIIDKAYHISIGPISGLTRQNVYQETEATVAIRVYFKGFREPDRAMDNAIDSAEKIMKECCSSENWATTAIKGVTLDSVEFLPLDNELNDNIIFALVTFAARVNVCVES